jgi:tetratricopeptide (TPR) repeat protein/predicted aspartyl protease
MNPRHRKGAVAALALGAVAAIAGSARAADCKFTRVVEVPVTMENFRPVVAVKINGQDTRLFVDTGAFFSAVSEDAAKTLGMKPSVAPFGLRIGGIGGASSDARAVEATDFSFVNAGFHNIQFLVGGRVGGRGLSGVMGENVLSPFDVEYDFANGVMRFFKPEGCGNNANLAYWSTGKALSRIPLDMPGRYISQIHASGKIDGRTIHVVLDSGVPLSILSRPAAERVGITIASEGVVSAGISYGVYGQAQEDFIAPFESFAIGDEEIKNTRLRMSNIKLPETDMLLGMDFFLSHRILVSTSQKKIYFTYNGGPVFRLDQRPQAQPPVEADAKTAGGGDGRAQTAAADVPKTASEFARRAAASATRRAYPEAIADYTQAIGLEPTNAAYYRSRAFTRLAANQPVLAMADLDEALKRQPDDPDALMRRGQLYLAGRDSVRAKADFQAAMKLAPENSDLIAQSANYYVTYGLYEDAIRGLDDWIAAHIKGYDLSGAQAARCFARAAWGQQLDDALADCDTAIRKDKNSVFMRSRALVLLRMGRTDDALAQYAAVIKLQPRDAVAIYGRGVAELKKGQTTEGDADIAAATAIARNIGAQYKRWGLAPDAPAAAAGVTPPAKS